MKHCLQGCFGSAVALVLTAGLFGLAPKSAEGSDVDRTAVALGATSTDSEVVIAVDDAGAHPGVGVYAFSTSDGHLLWRGTPEWDVTTIAVSPDDKTVALGLERNDSDTIAVLVDAASGKLLQEIIPERSLDFAPETTKTVAYAPDGSLFYGLTYGFLADNLIAWDVHTGKLVWDRKVPGGARVVRYDTANSFALSPDGSKLAFNRFGTVYMLPAGRTKPSRAPHLPGDIDNRGRDQPAFSPDGRYFATGYGGGYGSKADYGGMLWRLDGSKPVLIKNCGGDFAWTSDPQIFACQNGSGTHLRNIHDPQKDIGTAGPVSNVPFLKIGNSLWVAAYRFDDWKDPNKPLPLTLVELGTGKRVTVTLPGRTQLVTPIR